ncbi:hypothetical protein IP70_07330 [alpha proteobacterium AAP38]|uniref:4-(cytidine 5'-diphospho)-2-C-methyl-D-erythritol kinase n=1 Tax=Niveispirillum sp. TaxID=1917217 RepID=UPI0006B8C314|nr:hypothetical protein IP70_07330 [alpha proteobacterium AAP38]
MTAIRAYAAAKLNLYLHVLGRREDGYHLLDSLVAFASAHDLVEVESTPYFSLQLHGPHSLPLLMEDTESNLVTKAVFRLAEALGRKPHVTVKLTKNLPLASGIGGGSADAAATLRALCALWDVPLNHPAVTELAAKLGADVPVCVGSRTSYFAGTGTDLSPAPDLPEDCWVVLVNPGVSMPTPAVFEARDGAFSEPARLTTSFTDVRELAALLKEGRRNDLTPPAARLSPVITQVLAALDSTAGCLLSRMSGSGATCFGLYVDFDHAVAAAELIGGIRPGWWVQPAALLNDLSGLEVLEGVTLLDWP